MALTTLRIGETEEVVGRPQNVDGLTVTFLEAETWDSGDDAIATVTPDGVDPRLAEVEAVDSGTTTLSFEGTDQFSDTVSVNVPVTVLAPDRLHIHQTAQTNVVVRIVNGRWDLTPEHELSPGGLRVGVLAQALDVRGGGGPDYSGTLSNIAWSTVPSNGVVLFDTGGGANPTATGTLTLDLVPGASGDTVVHVQAENAIGGLIVCDLAVRVLGTAAVIILSGADVA